MEAVLNELVSVDDLLVRPGPEGRKGKIRAGGVLRKSDRVQTLFPSSVLLREAELRLPAAFAAFGSCREVPLAPTG